MPFTVLHMGPGLALKALAGRHFSLITFGVAQVAMDVEPLIRLVGGSHVLHGPTHTYLAALVIAGIVAVVSPPICRFVLRRWNQELGLHCLSWLTVSESVAPLPVIVGAFAGTIFHVFLDSLMHSDMSAIAPWSAANGLEGLVTAPSLHAFCVVSGLIGFSLWFSIAWFNKEGRHK